MDSIKVNNIKIFFESSERDTADLIAGACEKAIRQIGEDWDLTLPRNCRIYVMTSAVRFFFQSASLKWKILLVVSLPLWYLQLKKMWQYSGAWTQRYGDRVVIGIKSPDVLKKGDKSIGERVFVAEPDIKKKIQHFTCHELVHACAARLRLPMWLNEGIAMLTVDRFTGTQTVRADALNLVKNFNPKAPPQTRREIYRDKEKIAYYTLRGYWLVMYIEKTHPGLLKSLFKGPGVAKRINSRILLALEMDPVTFWSNIDDIIIDYFKVNAMS
jgi:hypothetical protein